MNKFLTITKETYKKNISSTGFIVLFMTPLLFLALIVGILYYTGDFNQSDSETDVTLALLSDPDVSEMVNTGLEAIESINIETDYSDEDSAEEELHADQIDGILSVQLDEETITASLNHTGELNQEITAIQQVLNSLQTTYRSQLMNINQEELTFLNEMVDLDVENVGVDSENDEAFTKQVVAYFVSFLIFIFILSYSSMMTEEVATEKGSRMMEIILSTVPAKQHFLGKITGVMLLLITQLIIYFGVFLLLFYSFRDSTIIQFIVDNVNFDLIFDQLIGYAAVYFFIGIVTYMILSAFIGSLITKIEDINKSVIPLTFVAMIGFFIGITALSQPDSNLIIFSSHFPLFTPFIMPFRIAAGSISNLTILISVLVSLGFSIIVLYLSLVFYKSNVLAYSDSGIIKNLQRSWKIYKNDKHKTI